MKSLFLSVLSLSTLAAFGEIDRTKKPEPGPAPAASFPDYETTVLPNGLKVFVIHDDRKPTVTFRLVIRGGAVCDGEKSGTASFVANLLNRGTQHLDASAFAKATDSIGMKLEVLAGDDSISVTAGGLTKYTGQVLDLFSDAVLAPSFAAEQFAKQKRKALSSLEAEKQEPAKLAEKLTGKIVFGSHPYGNYETPRTVNAIGREDVVRMHHDYFVPNNATLAVVGDVDSAAILKEVERVFGNWARGDVPEKTFPEIPRLHGLLIHLVDRPGSVQSNIVVVINGPARNNPDTPELNVLNATLGGGFSGRLFQNLREKHGWTYGAYSAFDLLKYGGAFEANAETRNEVTAPAVAETLKEIQRMRDEPVPEPELTLQRQYNVGNYLLSLENTSRTAQRVQDIDLFGLSPDFYKTYARRMGATTAEQVTKLAQQYLTPDNAAVIVVGEAKEIRPALEKIGKVVVYDTTLKPLAE